MPQGRKIDFVPEEHVDFIFRIETTSVLGRAIARLITPIALFLMRLAYGVSRLFRRRRAT
jgi:hypothetical protein